MVHNMPLTQAIEKVEKASGMDTTLGEALCKIGGKNVEDLSKGDWMEFVEAVHYYVEGCEKDTEFPDPEEVFEENSTPREVFNIQGTDDGCEACQRLRRNLTWYGEPPKCKKHTDTTTTYWK